MKIFILWDKGEAAAPVIVRNVIRRWRELNPTHDIKVLDGRDLDAELSGTRACVDHLNVQARADIMRLKLLAEHGGVWADATLIPVRPLDEWLPGVFHGTGFFSFRQCGFDRVLGNWFIAAEAGNPLVVEWYEAVLAYFSTPRRPANETSPVWRLRRKLAGGYLSTIQRGRRRLTPISPCTTSSRR
jgi:mannosyltransferase OCH1-like enzyme